MTVNGACLFMMITCGLNILSSMALRRDLAGRRYCTGGVPVVNRWNSLAEMPARTPLSDIISKDLKKRGFTFVGSTICYAFMQAAGLVNDHLVVCLRHPDNINL
jgi:3-methyladenine DNA glycosylase Tag